MVSLKSLCIKEIFSLYLFQIKKISVGIDQIILYLCNNCVDQNYYLQNATNIFLVANRK